MVRSPGKETPPADVQASTPISSARVPRSPVGGQRIPGRFEFHLFCGKEGLEALRQDWTAITQNLRRRAFWHLYDWYACYMDALASDDDILCIVASCRGHPVGVLPLHRRTQRFSGITLETLEIPAHPHMPLSDLILDLRFVPPDFFTLFRHFLQRQGIAWDALLMPNVPADSYALSLVEAADWCYVTVPARKYDVVRAKGNYDALVRRFSAKTRENLRRARRRLAQAGRVEYVTARTAGDLEYAFDAFLALEASGWKGAHGARTAIALDARLRRFYQGLIDRLVPHQQCQIAVLKLDGQPIAAQFCLVVDNTVYTLKIGYDETSAKLSPGKMLLDHTIQSALAARRDVNLVSDAKWHGDWRPIACSSTTIFLFNSSPRGLLAYGIARAEGFARSVFSKTRP